MRDAIRLVERDGWRLTRTTGSRSDAVQYVIVYEQTPNNWSAYVPDLPGCIAAGDTREETGELIREAVALHIESLRAYKEPVPMPGVWTGIVEVPESVAAGS